MGRRLRAIISRTASTGKRPTALAQGNRAWVWRQESVVLSAAKDPAVVVQAGFCRGLTARISCFTITAGSFASLRTTRMPQVQLLCAFCISVRLSRRRVADGAPRILVLRQDHDIPLRRAHK